MDTAGVPVNDTSGSRRLDSQVTVRDDAAASARGRQDTLPTDHNSTRTEGAEAERIQSIDWDTFIADLAVLAEKQFSPEWNQDTYVDEVGALMQLLDLDDSKFQALYDGYATAASLFPDLNTVHEGGYFEVATLEFDPGDTIDLHNHPDMTGVILCLSGMLQVEAFDLLDEISDSGQLLIKRVVNREVEPGEYCTLTATHGNIHTVSAPVFTQLLDVFTPPYNDERLTRYRWYERAQTPYSGEDIFEAWEQ
jgi:cysteamine dioxygenase